MTQMPSVPDLQQALSGVPPRVWTARMDRRVERARSAGLSSIEIPEFAEAGVLMWRAELTGAGAASLAAWGASKPTRRRWLLRLRRWTGTTVFAPHVGVGTLGEHHWGEITSVVFGGIVGFVVGGWFIGGPLSVIYSALIGAAVGWAGWWLFLFAGRRRIVGRPVNVTDPEVMTLSRLVGRNRPPSQRAGFSRSKFGYRLDGKGTRLSDRRPGPQRRRVCAPALPSPDARSRCWTRAPGAIQLRHHHRNPYRSRNLDEGRGRHRPCSSHHRTAHRACGRLGRDRQLDPQYPRFLACRQLTEQSRERQEALRRRCRDLSGPVGWI